MKAKKRKNGKLSAIVMLSVLLVLTIVQRTLTKEGATDRG